MEGTEALDDEGALAGFVGGGVAHVRDDAGCETDAEDQDEGEGYCETEEREAKDLPWGCGRRVINKEVGCCSGVGYGCA